MIVENPPLESEPSPRSTVFPASAHMTTNMATMNESNMASDKAASEAAKMSSIAQDGRKDDALGSNPNPACPSPTGKDTADSNSKNERKINPEKVGIGQEEDAPPTPNPYEYPVSHVHGYHTNLTPQGQSAAYHYLSYNQQHMTPEPPSPAGPHAVTDVYNVGSFFHQPPTGAFAVPPHQSVFTGGAMPNSNTNNSNSNANLSPSRGGMPTVGVTMAGTASPLFPRPTAGGLDGQFQQRGSVAPPSPNIPYIMSPHQLGGGANSMYQTYPVAGVGSHSSDDWGGVSAGADRYVRSLPVSKYSYSFR
jgi:hypothetical protein